MKVDGFRARDVRAGRALAWLLAACLGLALLVLLGQRAFAGRGHGEDSSPGPTEPERVEVAGRRAEPAAPGLEARVALPEQPAPAPALGRLTGRLQINGYAALRGRVLLRSEDGAFTRELAIDDGGRFYCEEVPPTRLLAAFEAEGVFERQLVLPDHFEILPRAGELTVVDLDWWTRHVNVVVHSEDGLPGPARVELEGPGYATHVEVDESGLQRLDLIGEGIFTFRATTPRGLVGVAELELERGDDLDTAVLIARIKDH